MDEIYLLPHPGKDGRLRRFVFLFLCLMPFAFGALALFLGQDANWDLRNYHWYNAYAFLSGRYGFDLLPSQTPYFYNPLLDVPFYLLATHVSARVAGFILGSIQGLNFVLLFMLSFASLKITPPQYKVIACALLAALGMLGGGGIAQIGTTFYDNVTSLGLFISALLVLWLHPTLMNARVQHALIIALVCGLPAGLMMGLKLPSVVFCIGLCFALLFVPGPHVRRLFICIAFGIGVLAGTMMTLGYWMWYLQTHFGSPLFPYFNDYFKSPLAPLTSARDTQFLSGGIDRLIFPYIFAKYPMRVGEIAWRDWRIPILYTLLPLAFLLRLIFSFMKRRTETFATPFAARYLLWVGILSYIVWLWMFSIYRYALPLEMLTPLLIVMAIDLLPVKIKSRAILAVVLLLIIAASVQPGNWHRRTSWLDHFVEVKVPSLSDTSNLMILMAGYEPYGHVIPAFPPDIPFVRIESNFTGPHENKGINQIIRDRVEAHHGRFMMLIPPDQKNIAEDALSYFKLALAPQACQTVKDRLYDDTELALCNVVHKSRDQ